MLSAKNVVVLPDFLCNAGGVTVSYFEMVQNACGYYWTEEEVHQRLAQRMTTVFWKVHEVARQHGLDYRQAAYLAAVSRVAEPVRLRGWA